MQRRQILSAVSTVGVASFAGCSGLFETQPVGERGTAGGSGEPPVLEDRPEAVYIPSHREGMEMIGMGEAGDYMVGLMFSFPHRFWIVTGSERERVAVRDEDDVHLMATVWDGETGTVLPVSAGLSMEIERDGEFITEKSPWPMLSQPMGFHYGDNFALEDEGTYTVNVSIGGMDIARFGSFDGKFGERGSATIDFEFSTQERNSIMVENLEDRHGERDALELMEMDMMPTSTVHTPEDLPGRVIGESESGDGRFVATAVEDAPFVESDGVYLLISARTPYNRIPLPMMSLSYRLQRESEVIAEGQVQEGIEPSAGYHYGTSLQDISSGDTLTISVDSPPQVSRHEGYETAFMDMSDMEFSIE